MGNQLMSLRSNSLDTRTNEGQTSLDEAQTQARLDAFNRKLDNRRKACESSPAKSREYETTTSTTTEAAARKQMLERRNSRVQFAEIDEGMKAFQSRHSAFICPSTQSSPIRTRQHMKARRTSSAGKALDESAINAVGLTVNQVAIIRNAWVYARKDGEHEPGKSIMLSVLAHGAQAVRRLFTALMGDVDSPAFMAHSVAFSSFLNSIITHLDSDAVVCKKLRDLGAKHVSILERTNHAGQQQNGQFTTSEAGHNLTADDWTVFMRAMMDCTEKWGGRRLRCSQLMNAWKLLIARAVDKMKEGYYLEIKKRRTRNWSALLNDDQKSNRKIIRRESVHATPMSSRKHPLLIRNNTTVRHNGKSNLNEDEFLSDSQLIYSITTKNGVST